MDVMSTPLGLDIINVIETGQGYRAFDISAVVHCNGVDVPAIKVINKGDYEDFVNGYCTEFSLVVLIPSGKYVNRIIPAKDNLEITLSSNALNEVQNNLDQSGNRIGSTERFKAVLVTPEDTSVSSRNKVALDEMGMDLSDIDVVEFQLVSKAMEIFSLRYCGGIYRKIKTEDLVKSLLLAESSTIDLEADYKPKGVSMVEVLDKTVKEQYVIDHGVASKDGPAYIHKNLGGVYSAGLSYFYLNDYWYVFPTFDYSRFNKAEKQLVVLRVPDGKFPQIEKTYKKYGDVLTVLATAGASSVDSSDSNSMRDGNGVRFTNASSLFNDPVETSGNKAIMRRKDNVTEFMSKKRASGLNNITSNDVRITSNNLYEASKLAARNGVKISFVWENSNPELIIPGMQTKFMYYSNGKIHELFGVVIAKETDIVYTGVGLTAGTYVRSTVVHLFMQFQDKQ